MARSRQYKVLLPLRVHTADGSYGQGEVFEKDFTPDEEQTNLASGLLELVPSTYRVLTDTRVHETDKDGTFDAAFLIENEAALIQAGLIKRVDPPKAAPTKTKQKKEEED